MFQQLVKQVEAGSLHVQIGKTFHLDQKRVRCPTCRQTSKWIASGADQPTCDLTPAKPLKVEYFAFRTSRKADSRNQI